MPENKSRSFVCELCGSDGGIVDKEKIESLRAEIVGCEQTIFQLRTQKSSELRPFAYLFACVAAIVFCICAATAYSNHVEMSGISPALKHQYLMYQHCIYAAKSYDGNGRPNPTLVQDCNLQFRTTTEQK